MYIGVIVRLGKTRAMAKTEGYLKIIILNLNNFIGHTEWEGVI